jgi:hypothetical protein
MLNAWVHLDIVLTRKISYNALVSNLRTFLNKVHQPSLVKKLGERRRLYATHCFEGQ